MKAKLVAGIALALVLSAAHAQQAGDAAAGQPEALKRFEAWLEHGPRGARVDTLEELPAPARVLRGFELG